MSFVRPSNLDRDHGTEFLPVDPQIAFSVPFQVDFVAENTLSGLLPKVEIDELKDKNIALLKTSTSLSSGDVVVEIKATPPLPVQKGDLDLPLKHESPEIRPVDADDEEDSVYISFSDDEDEDEVLDLEAQPEAPKEPYIEPSTGRLPALGAKVKDAGATLFGGLRFGGALLYNGASWIAGAGGAVLSTVKDGTIECKRSVGKHVVACGQSAGGLLTGYQINKLKKLRMQDSLGVILKDADFAAKLRVIDPEGQLEPLSKKLCAQLLPHAESFVAEALQAQGCYAGNAVVVKEFLEVYLQQLAMQIIYQLAVGKQDISSDAEPKQLLLLNVMTRLAAIFHTGLGEGRVSALQEQIRRLDRIEDKSLKNLVLNDLRNELFPLSSALLTAVGIESIEDLRLRQVNGISQVVDYYLGDPWTLGTLGSEIVPDALISLLCIFDTPSTLTLESQACVNAFSGAEHLPGYVDALQDYAQDLVKGEKALLATIVASQIGVSAASVETLLTHFNESRDVPILRFWSALRATFAPALTDFFKAISLPNPLGCDALTAPQNVFERIILNVIKLLHGAINGKDVVLHAKFVAYDRLELLLSVLQSAKAYFLAEQKAGRLAVDQLTEEEMRHLQERCMAKILEEAIEPGKRAALTSALRHYFEAADLESGEALLRKLLFHSKTAANIRTSHDLQIGIDKNIAKLTERLSDVLDGTFGGLENDLLELLGLNSEARWHQAKFSVFCDFNTAKHQLLPSLFLKLYRDFYPIEQDLETDLQVLLYQNPALANGRDILRDILVRGPGVNAHDRQFVENTGVAAPRQLIDESLAVVSGDIASAVKQLLSSERDIGALLEPLLAHMAAVNSDAKAALLKGLSRSFASEDPSMQAVFTYLQQTFETALLKVLVKIGQGTAPAMPASQMIGKALLEIFKRLNAHKAEIASHLHHAREEGTEAFRAAFRPLVAELISFAGLSAAEIPGPAAFKTALWTKLMQDVLPDYIGKLYLSMTSLEGEAVRNSNDAKLARIYGTSHPQVALHAIAQFTAESVQSYVALNSAEIAELLYSNLYDYLRWGALANAQREPIVDLFNHNISFAAQPGETMSATLQSAKEYIHSIFSTAFTNLSENIDKVDRIEGPAFLQKFGFGIVEIFHDHVKEINRIREEEGEVHAFDVSSMRLLEGFAAPENPASLQDEEKLPNLALMPEYQAAKKELRMAEAVLKKVESVNENIWPSWAGKTKQQHVDEATKACATAKAAFHTLRQERYFAPLARKLLKFAKLDSASFPAFPEALRLKLWDLLENSLLPSMLDNLCLNLMRPQTLDSIMHSVITAMNQTLGDIATEEENPQAAPAVAASPADIEQNRLCGSAISAMLSLFPKTMSKSIFDLEAVRGASEPVIGAAIRDVLGSKSMIERIDQILVSALPALLPDTEWYSEAGDAPGHERFGFRPLYGERGSGSSDRSYNLPLSHDRLQQMEKEKAEAEAAMPSKLKSLMVEKLSEKIQLLIESTLMAPWEAFCTNVKKAFKERWGETASYALLEKALEIIKAIWLFIAQFTVIPLYRCVWFFIERYYLSYRADEIIRNFRMADVHEQFLFSSLNLFVKSFEEKLDRIEEA